MKMEPVEVKGPEPLPVKVDARLRDTVKPANRERDRGGILVALGSALLYAAGEIASRTPEIVHVLVSVGVDSAVVDVAVKGLALAGAIYAMVTKSKGESGAGSR